MFLDLSATSIIFASSAFYCILEETLV